MEDNKQRLRIYRPCIKDNGTDVQAFDQLAEVMGTEASQVSRDGISTGWMRRHFFRSGRLLVLFAGTGTTILDLLNDA